MPARNAPSACRRVKAKVAGMARLNVTRRRLDVSGQVSRAIPTENVAAARSASVASTGAARNAPRASAMSRTRPDKSRAIGVSTVCGCDQFEPLLLGFGALAARAGIPTVPGHAGDLDDPVAADGREELLALRRAALLRDVLRRDPRGAAAARQDHELVSGDQLLRGDERAGLRRDLERRGPDPASPLDRVLGDRRALGVPL